MSETTNESSGVGSRNCEACRDGFELPFSFSMAFQPIIDLESREVFAYEALVRGSDGESAASVLGQVDEENRYRFDQACRVKAIELAAGLDRTQRISINFLPNAVYEPATCIRATLESARKHDFPLKNIMFEFTEGERMIEVDHVKGIVEEYKRNGLMTAIDDFGAGFAGLNLLSRFQPDVIKIDMDLTREIHREPMKQAIVEAVLDVCRKFDIKVIAEGIETPEEMEFLKSIDVRLFQGYLFARPAFEAHPAIAWPA